MAALDDENKKWLIELCDRKESRASEIEGLLKGLSEEARTHAVNYRYRVGES